MPSVVLLILAGVFLFLNLFKAYFLAKVALELANNPVPLDEVCVDTDRVYLDGHVSEPLLRFFELADVVLDTHGLHLDVFTLIFDVRSELVKSAPG